MSEHFKHYLISGRVQGVGFRAFAARFARELDLKGWVRNLNDGRVEAVAKGPAQVLEEFEKRLRQGPAGGRVDMLVIGVPPPETVNDFEVRKDGLKACVD